MPSNSTGTETTLTSFSFSKANIPRVVLKDIKTMIVNDEIKISTPFINKPQLKATFEIKGEKVLVNGKEQESGVTIKDFSSPVIYMVVSLKGKEQEYKVPCRIQVCLLSSMILLIK